MPSTVTFSCLIYLDNCELLLIVFKNCPTWSIYSLVSALPLNNELLSDGLLLILILSVGVITANSPTSL